MQEGHVLGADALLFLRAPFVRRQRALGSADGNELLRFPDRPKHLCGAPGRGEERSRNSQAHRLLWPEEFWPSPFSCFLLFVV